MRKALILLVVLLSILALASPGRADFHAACKGIATGFGGASMTANPSGSQFSFSGFVNCPGADITISSVKLESSPAAGPALGTASATCTDSLAPCSATGTGGPASAGLFTVTVNFTVTGTWWISPPETTFTTSRVVYFQYPGVGQPYPVTLPAY